MDDKDSNKERRSSIRPLDSNEVLPLLRLLPDPSGSVRTAALRALLLLLPLYPQLRFELEGYITSQEDLALITAAKRGLDNEVQRSSDVPLDREKTRDPAEYANLQENARELADSYLKRLEAGGDTLYLYLRNDEIETLSYLDQERATLLITALFANLLEAALEDQDTGYMAGNEVVRLVASYGSAFVPDIPALFDIYLMMHEQVLPAREEWYRTGDDDVIFFTTNYLAVSWQLAWTLSRAGIQQVLTDLTPSLSASDVNKRLAAAQLIEDVIRYAPVADPPQFGGGSGPPGIDIPKGILDKIKSFVSPPPPPKLVVSVAHPRLLSKRFSSPFKVSLYPPEQQAEAHDRLKQGFEKSEIEKIDGEDTGLTSGLTVVIKLTSPDVEFDEPVTKRLEDRINIAAFTAKPSDNCHPGYHIVKLSITNKATEVEYVSHTFEVKIADFLVDSISRPLVQKTMSGAIGVGSLLMFALTLLSKIDTTFGLASGTVAVVLAGGIYRHFQALYQQPKTTTTNAP